MAHGTCGVPECGDVGRLARGWCQACYGWSRHNGWADPAGRPRHDKAPQDGQCTVVEDGERCTRPYYGRGMCSRHRRAQSAAGDPLKVMKQANDAVRAQLRAAAYTETDRCIMLDGRPERRTVRADDGYMWASRFVWIIRHGDPGEDQVLHTCNGGSGANGCINIRHLRLGDNSRNVLDRGDAGVKIGEDHHQSRLKAEQVRLIRQRAAAGETYTALAIEYGVARQTVGDVVSRRTWRRLA